MHRPHATHTQFSLRSLLILTTIFAALFAFLSALGVSPAHTLLGFTLLGGIIAAQTLLIEVAYRVLGMR